MKANPDKRWADCLALIRSNVAPQPYSTWFKPIVFELFDEQTKTIRLQVPSTYVYEYLEENYVDLLCKVLRRVFGEGVRLTYRVVTDKEHKLSQDIEADPTDPNLRPRQTSRANKAPSELDAARPQELDPHLNPHQTFENFIEGASNKVARTIGLSIADNQHVAQFNPMFVYGPSGCGKTHLINAIGVRMKQMFPQKRVLYISAHLFQIQFVNATLQNSVPDFINFYQTIDVLIVDDVQEWMTAGKTQDTFFHIFNHLFRNGRHIILASDRPPVDLKGMNERLITRFACGLITELGKPDTKLSIDILNAKCRRDGLKIPSDVIEYIAETASGSVRELEGVVNSLLAYSVVYNCNIDMRLAERVIKRAVKVDDEPLTIDDILEKVCSHYNVSQADVNSKSRKHEIVEVRQLAMYFAQKYTKMPASRIGKLVGGRDHATVIHSCNRVSTRMKTDKAFLEEIRSIETTFGLKQ